MSLPVRIDPVFGCAVFDGRRTRDGYGRVGGRGAHIVAWELEHGEVPDGLVLDHLCRNRACVALHHLEPVDQSENERRKSWGYRARRKLCRAGHVLADTAAVTPHGGRVCRQCGRDAAARAAG